MKGAIFYPVWGTQVTGLSALFKFALLVFLLQQNLSSQVLPDKNVDNLLNKGISNLINQNYSAANKIFLQLENQYPGIPLGKIYSAASAIAESYDNSEEINNAAIEEKLKSALNQAESILKKDNRNIWNVYYLALAEGYYAYYNALNSNWLSALSGGLNSVSEFNRCLEMDSSFYEAYAAIGTYKYWKSRKTEFLNWLPFVDDEKQEGLTYLNKALSGSSYSKYLAIYSLQWIYIDSKLYPQAAVISEQALKQFPESRFFKWGYARALEENNLIKAAEIYKEILYSYIPKASLYNEIFLKHLMAQCYSKAGEKQKALKLCAEILAIKDIPENVKEKLGNRLERVRTLQKELFTAK